MAGVGGSRENVGFGWEAGVGVVSLVRDEGGLSAWGLRKLSFAWDGGFLFLSSDDSVAGKGAMGNLNSDSEEAGDLGGRQGAPMAGVFGAVAE